MCYCYPGFALSCFLSFFFFNLILFIFGCVGSSLLCVDFSCGARGLLFVAVLGLLIVVASLVVEHGL